MADSSPQRCGLARPFGQFQCALQRHKRTSEHRTGKPTCRARSLFPFGFGDRGTATPRQPASVPAIHALIAARERTSTALCWTGMPGAVAIYEDDAGIRTVLLDLVEMEGFDVLVCSSVFELHQAAIAGARA